MKNFITPLLAVFLVSILYSCSTPRQTASRYSDDIYFVPGDVAVKKQEPQKPQPRIYPDVHQEQTINNQAGVQEEYYDPQYQGEPGSVTNNYYGDVNNFNSDDYYDYSYTARIRRFHQPSMGMAYYDPWFTNAYFYSYDPFMWGTSIYMGYNFWNPRPWGWGWGGGWGYGGWGWGGGWGYPGWGWGGGGYWGGYNHGYWDGYHHGLASTYYYNSFDRTLSNTHYGPRGGGAGGGSAGRSVSQQRSIGQLYQSAVATERPRGGTTSGRTEVARGNASSTERVPAAGRGTEQISRGDAPATINRPDRSAAQEASRTDALSRPSREAVTPGRGNDAAARPGREAANVNPNAQNNPRAAVAPQQPAATRPGEVSREAQVPSRGTESRTANAPQQGNGSAARPGSQAPQTQNPHYSRQQAPQSRPNVQPNPSAQPQRATPGQNGQQQQPSARPQPGYDRQQIYNSPKRNPNAYQPAQPGNVERSNSQYNRQPAFERPTPQRNTQPQQRTYDRQQQSPQQRPGYSPSQPQQRQSSPSYSAPSRGSSPSYSAPSRGSAPSYSAPSGGGGGGSAPRGSGGGGSPRSPR